MARSRLNSAIPSTASVTRTKMARVRRSSSSSLKSHDHRGRRAAPEGATREARGRPHQKELRAKREADGKARREAEHRRWIEQERVRQERDRLEKLLDEAQRASQFSALRDYLDLIERAALRSGGATEWGKSWLAEARRLLELYDPPKARLGRRSDDDDYDDEAGDDEPSLSQP